MGLKVRLRDRIVREAYDWAWPRAWQPTPEYLRDMFIGSGNHVAPTLDQARRSLSQLGTGVFVGQGQWEKVEHWCGIFACYVWRKCGIANVRWSSYGGGTIVGAKKGAVMDLEPGDIAVIGRLSHHFIVCSVDRQANRLLTVEGNTIGQYIKEWERPISVAKDGKPDPLSSVVGVYRVPE